MKRSLAAILTCTAAGAACAQSSVTIFGSVDLNLTYAKAGSASVTGMDQGGYDLPSRIGFRGTEDLSNGLSAGFWLEMAVLPDSGDTQGGAFSRRSTVSLASRDYGELRFGRDYSPVFWNVTGFGPFGTVGVGGVSNIIQGWLLGLGNAQTLGRASNSLGYFLPSNLGGVYGQLMVAASEGIDGTEHAGARLGYESGPLNVAVAFGRTPTTGGDYRTAALGGWYDFGVVKLYLNTFRHKLSGDKQTIALVGASVPVGVGTLNASWAHADRSGPGLDANDASQYAIGYVHPLSKRTTLYSAYSRIINHGHAAYVTSDVSPPGVPGQASTGLQGGIRHDF